MHRPARGSTVSRERKLAEIARPRGASGGNAHTTGTTSQNRPTISRGLRQCNHHNHPSQLQSRRPRSANATQGCTPPKRRPWALPFHIGRPLARVVSRQERRKPWLRLRQCRRSRANLRHGCHARSPPRKRRQSSGGKSGGPTATRVRSIDRAWTRLVEPGGSTAERQLPCQGHRRTDEPSARRCFVPGRRCFSASSWRSAERTAGNER